jgi:hypothetical protein
MNKKIYKQPKSPAGKVTLETVRELASALPGVEESTSRGAISFKANGKMLTCQAISKSAEPNSLVVRMDRDQRDALIADDPDTYYITDHYKPYPSVLVRLSRVSPDTLRDLLLASWRHVTSGKKRR